MLQIIEDLPTDTVGIIAQDEVTKSDYEEVLLPLLKSKYIKGDKIKLLYQTGPNFSGYTMGAIAQDFMVGMKYLRLFSRCAIVTDVDWMKRAGHFVGSLMPCPMKIFSSGQFKEAMAWLSEPVMDSNLKFELSDEGVLVVHLSGPLQQEDFDKLSSIVDPWIESHNQLHSLVVSTPKFPGWENIGSFIQHMEFIRDHHKKIKKVALTADGILPEVVSRLGSHFIEAEVRQFAYGQLKEALEWARMDAKSTGRRPYGDSLTQSPNLRM